MNKRCPKGQMMPNIRTKKRNRIYQRDGHRCQCCGSVDKLTVDHIIPVSRGGDNKDTNLQVLCTDCNQWKGDRVMEFGPLRKRPDQLLKALKAAANYDYKKKRKRYFGEKPLCRCCSSKAFVSIDRYAGSMARPYALYRVRCGLCHCAGLYFKTSAEAIRYWIRNIRPCGIMPIRVAK